MVTSIPMRYELVAGSGTAVTNLNVYKNKERLDNNNLGFVKIANYLMKNIQKMEAFMPSYEKMQIYIDNELKDYIKYYYRFADLMYIDGTEGITYKYDINKAYLTMLSPFIPDDKFEKFYKNKEEFIKAVGFTGYRYYIRDILTNEIVAFQNAKRPDILNFCIEALNFIKDELFELMGSHINFYYIDCCGFDISLDEQLDDYNELLTLILKNFYEKNGIDSSKMKNVTVKKEGEYEITYKNGIYYLGDHPFFAIKNNRLYNL